MDKFSCSSVGVQIKGASAYSNLNMTIEGIGNDATINGFGFLLRNAGNHDIRKNTIINYYTCLKETGANNEINTIYLGGQDKIIDLNYIVEAYGKKTNIDMDLKGAISGNCKKHFKGTFYINKFCKN